MKIRPFIIILILLLTYLGPYAFVYGRTATWTFPRIDERDLKAIEGVESSVSPVVNLTNIESVSGAHEGNYSINVGVLHRKFLDWIGFPLVLEVNNFNFKALGIYQGKIILECRHFEPAFPKSSGNQPWYIYQPLVDKNDNSYLDVSCYGDASSIEPVSVPKPIMLNWSISATMVGDRNEQVRSWTNSQSAEIRDVRS